MFLLTIQNEYAKLKSHALGIAMHEENEQAMHELGSSLDRSLK